jgi:hypothetical protein
VVKTPADGAGDNPTRRSDGAEDVAKVTNIQSNCNSINFLEVFSVRVWAAVGVTKTYRYYVQTDFATLPAAEIKLTGEYLDQSSGGHLAAVTSTQGITTRASQSDWSQYVEVTFTPQQEGWVNLIMRLMGYEAGKKVWVDPQLAVT